ncbi:hypothetical protein HWV07_09030 [Natronomonas salina]|uniref:hypothetical protein n=1 Tax=Natronomonas salina TaxID=1710540 RepID=UPI0015B39641|nr:hypothetical protein [Natronomonas salina]QLD89167.1 hypothetical protein HWV07_09030 [Natronomonas salina]
MHHRQMSSRSTRDALRIGVATGVTILCLSLVTGYFVGGWSLSDFLTHLTPATVGWVVLASGMAIAVFAIPIAAYLRLQVVAPLVILGLLLLGWIGLGLGQGIPLTAVFGLALYALYLSPVYLLLYLVCGGIEYRVQN